MIGFCASYANNVSAKAVLIAGCCLAALTASAPSAAESETALSKLGTPVSASLGPIISLSRIELDEEATCLAQNIYFEARSEPVDGMLAVGHVVLNRVASKRFPDSICNVVRQGGDRRRHRCQFSWWCDGRSDQPHNKLAWDTARLIAWFVYSGQTEDPTGGALWYHADYVNPSWREAFVAGPQIGRHIFYRDAEDARS